MTRRYMARVMKSHVEWRGSKNSINATSSRGEVHAWVYTRMYLFSTSVHRPLSVNCIASIKSLGERKRAKAQFSEIARCQKLIVGQTDWLTDWSIDSVPSAKIGPHNRSSICRQFMQKSTFELSSFFPRDALHPGEKNKNSRKNKRAELSQFYRLALVILVWNFIFNTAYRLPLPTVLCVQNE